MQCKGAKEAKSHRGQKIQKMALAKVKGFTATHTGVLLVLTMMTS
jgi:hypothetical protein